VTNLANVGSAVAKIAGSYVLTTGVQSSGTIASVAALDGTPHSHTHATDAIDLYYVFNIGAGIPSSVTMTGYLNTQTDTMLVKGYDWVAAGFVTIGSLTGKAASTNEVNTFNLFVDMVGTGANQGKVHVQFVGASGMTSATLAVDQIFCSFSQGSSSYEGGQIWIDGSITNTGVQVGIDGVSTNPVSTIAAAKSLSALTNLNKYHIANGTTITLADNSDNIVMEGHEWTLALGGQAVASAMFIDATISGTGTGEESEYQDCIIGTMTIPPSQYYNCSFTGTQTLVSAGGYRYINCQSGVPGSGAPTFALGTGDMTVEFRRWSGGINLTGIGLNDVLTISGEMGTIDLGSATAGTVEVRGTYKAITNGSSGVTVNLAGAILGGDVAAILVDTGTTLDGKIDTIGTDTAATQVLAAGATGFAAIDTVVDAVKAKTDSLTFTTPYQVDANTLAINSATVVGDGNATPWDGA
jgi:hypothetical protein